MRFLVTNDQAGKPSWWLYASNGQMVAWAGESFASMTNANRAATSFKLYAFSSRFEIYQDTGNHWRWRAWRSSDRVASSGESFSSAASASTAAENVRLNAGSADGP